MRVTAIHLMEALLAKDDYPTLAAPFLEEDEKIIQAVRRFDELIWKKGFQKEVQELPKRRYKKEFGNMSMFLLVLAGRVLLKFDDHVMENSVVLIAAEYEQIPIGIQSVDSEFGKAAGLIDYFTNCWDSLRLQENT